jgi:hypothetical protein
VRCVDDLVRQECAVLTSVLVKTTFGKLALAHSGNTFNPAAEVVNNSIHLRMDLWWYHVFVL